ncbi:ParA family protein [Legionella lytica]|uniref:ParA family protein n=1 Tax=Legionella lytica TaxID=96232 RepID=A0ABW8DBT6_9GAMM
MKTISTKDFSSLINVSPHLIYKIIKEHALPVVPVGNKNALPPDTVRRILEIRGYTFKRHINEPLIINVFGMKGGIGKTSIATAFAEGASRLGYKVLAIDLDMQANLTQSFNMKRHGQPVLYHAIIGDKKISEVIVPVTPNLHLLPSSLDNSQMEHVLNSKQTINITNYFDEMLEPIKNKYDLIVIDCPPSIHKITVCASCFATENLIPINADIDSFDGVVMTVSEIEKIERSFKNLFMKINYKIIFNKYDAREKLSLNIMGSISERQNLKENLLPIVIRTNTAFKNTKADGEYIFDANKSTAKEDCFALISELTGLSNWVTKGKGSLVKEVEETVI